MATSLSGEGRGKKHQCPHCGKRFNRPSSMKIHVNTHTGAKRLMGLQQRIVVPTRAVGESLMSTRICAVTGEITPGTVPGAYLTAVMCQTCLTPTPISHTPLDTDAHRWAQSVNVTL
ncbi:hypothetical protein ID866_4752 [Astraeus odoratus]|nr:hypothetical protein ID866_4752 [Astraeus odoratus]